MQRLKRIVVKIGSNVLARADGSLDTGTMSSLVDQIVLLRERGLDVILISSGAVASGRGECDGRRLKKMDSVEQRQLFSAIGQVRLINEYSELFGRHGVLIGQILTTKESFGTRRHYLNQKQCMEVMLENGVVPVINENDTISVTELMFTDNDELSALVATMMDAGILVILSNIDGIYDGDPNEGECNIIRNVEIGKDLSDYIHAGKSNFGRGGMLTKCRIAQKVAKEGIKVIIANGRRKDILPSLLFSPESVDFTQFIPVRETASGIKRWIAHSSGFTKGKIYLNGRAVEALLGKRAVSVLPVGVIKIEGEFEKDDLVSIADAEGSVLGIGKSAYSSKNALQVLGKHGCRPIVHYDYLYLEY